MTVPLAATERLEPAVLAAAGLTVALWGGTPLVTKLAVGGVDAAAVGALRTLLAGALALPILLLCRLRFPAKREARSLLVIAALGGFVFFPILFSLGQARTTTAHGALILAVLPVLTGLMAAAVERRLPSRRWCVGAAIAGVGTLILISGQFDLVLTGADPLGDLLILLGAAGASAGYVAGARAARFSGAWAVTFWGLAIGGLALLPVAPLLLSNARLPEADVAVWACLIYLAAGSSILAYAAWYWALGRGGIGRVGVTQYFQPLVSLSLAILVLGEALRWPTLLAAVLILGGVLFATRAATPRAADPR